MNVYQAEQVFKNNGVIFYAIEETTGGFSALNHNNQKTASLYFVEGGWAIKKAGEPSQYVGVPLTPYWD